MLRFFRKTTSPQALPLGARGERAAAEYLRGHGYTIREMNFKNPVGRRLGEIDIIAEKRKKIIFVEVKTRIRTDTDVLPEENIGREKLHRLEKIADYYIKTRGLQDREYGFDALAIEMNDSGEVKIRHLQDIFL